MDQGHNFPKIIRKKLKQNLTFITMFHRFIYKTPSNNNNIIKLYYQFK